MTTTCDRPPIDYQRLEQLAFEATGLAVYVVGDDVLPVGDDYMAATDPTLHVAAEDGLRTAGRWRGPLPTVAFSPVAIGGWARSRVRSDAEFHAEFEAVTLAVLSHELSHVLGRRAPFYSRRIPETEAERQRECRITRMALGLSQDSVLSLSLPIWSGGHDHRWLRTALHLGYRVGQLAGVKIHWRQVAGELLLPVWRLAASLGSEPKRLRNLPIEEIKRRGMPRPYSRSWAAIYASGRTDADDGRLGKEI
ncbi:MAG: hypothetical protein NTY19_24065 [Planctomycetota bacterium]|nr:hypothetical protein [Planctomycetota bacterium]